MALSRWDIKTHDFAVVRHFAEKDSQDTWALLGGFPEIPEANFPLGKKGCDNRIAHLLSNHFDVINPSKEIITYHYHISGIRNYAPQGTNEDLVAPPYKFLDCDSLP